jgi:transglutaminase-like putative cysteine protease
MVRIQFSIDLQYEVVAPGADFVFNIHAAHTACQTVVHEQLQLSPTLLTLVYTDPLTASRYLRLSAAAGPLQVRYQATLDIRQHLAVPEQVPEVPVVRLPPQVLTYIYPSRYCQSDRLTTLAMSEFGHLPQGYDRILAIQDWVRRQVRFTSNSSDSTTSALDTLIDRAGVCRDFAHLMIALCRALSIPARFATGIDFGADPALGPTDFHAYVEVFLGDRWYIFDPSGTAIPMGFVRLGTGRDAADVAFATIFGSVSSQPPRLTVTALTDPAQGWERPQHLSQALSTDAAQAL